MMAFTVMAYCNDDLITCRKLADLGCAAVMPSRIALLAAEWGLINPYNLALIREYISRCAP